MASLKNIPFTLHPSHSRPASDARPIVIFTHHYGGSEKTVRRHVALVNELGFDAVTFNFSWHGDHPRPIFPFYLRNRWAREFGRVIDQIDGEKIIYSFSAVAASPVKWLAGRYKKGNFDVVGYIFDSGPFRNGWRCWNNYVREIDHIGFAPLRKLWVWAKMAFWGFGHTKSITADLQTVFSQKPDLPVLSIRSEKDLLVPLDEIEALFDGRNLKNLSVYVVKGCPHLAGLKNHPEEYEKKVKDFLSTYFS